MRSRKVDNKDKPFRSAAFIPAIDAFSQVCFVSDSSRTYPAFAVILCFRLHLDARSYQTFLYTSWNQNIK
jgi:hypothetical protein